MKSIKEKAKLYDGLIERLKDLKFAYRFSPLSDTIEEKFPELKESENENIDEKVRKALIKLVTNHASMDLFIEYDIHLDEALSWLEKQGEQKSIDNMTSQEAMDIVVAKCFNEGEQKPTDKAEPKFKVGDKIVEDNEFGIVGGEITDIDDTHYELDNGCRYIPISHQDNYKFVGKQSIIWSKEDDADFSAAMWAIQQAKTIAKDENDMGNLWCAERFLNSIKDRVQQTKQEWSEEDENRFNNLIFLVEHSDEGKKTKEGFIKFINRLKYQNIYKPDNEQIKALETTLYSNMSKNDKRYSILSEFVAELKKLREE